MAVTVPWHGHGMAWPLALPWHGMAMASHDGLPCHGHGSFVFSGLAVSYSAETFTGPTIILIAAASYFVSLLLPRLRKG